MKTKSKHILKTKEREKEPKVGWDTLQRRKLYDLSLSPHLQQCKAENNGASLKWKKKLLTII